MVKKSVPTTLKRLEEKFCLQAETLHMVSCLLSMVLCLQLLNQVKAFFKAGVSVKGVDGRDAVDRIRKLIQHQTNKVMAGYKSEAFLKPIPAWTPRCLMKRLT